MRTTVVEGLVIPASLDTVQATNFVLTQQVGERERERDIERESEREGGGRERATKHRRHDQSEECRTVPLQTRRRR